MKKIIKLFSILFLITLILVGCSGSDESNSKKVAEKFVRNLYTVDAKKVAEFNKLLATPIGGMIGEGVPKGSKIGPSEEYIKIMQSFDKNIQPLMTKEGYEGIVANKFNLLIAHICDKGNYTSQVTEFILGKNVYGEKEDKVRYYYEVKLKFISSDGKSEQADVSKGAIELLKENGQWKVGLYTITQFPKLYH
ncbi:hypothetical protein G9F72_011490 [Clostridium estertheticum]|uniref:hypothetical protein n=1 Tax=Clostridium estertheticum TaxID=238834 RepID=UPI0013E985A3|nr:hypothetical protein [Clostridium estertheticum]MBZ9686948.1 hypothetical protein [Clostridium estertheticum]